MLRHHESHIMLEKQYFSFLADLNSPDSMLQIDVQFANYLPSSPSKKNDGKLEIQLPECKTVSFSYIIIRLFSSYKDWKLVLLSCCEGGKKIVICIGSHKSMHAILVMHCHYENLIKHIPMYIIIFTNSINTIVCTFLNNLLYDLWNWNLDFDNHKDLAKQTNILHKMHSIIQRKIQTDYKIYSPTTDLPKPFPRQIGIGALLNLKKIVGH